FQRFRDLLDPTTQAGELAHLLFEHPRAKVLLLSATPYKPYTLAEEDPAGHHQEFLATVSFLASGASDVVQQVDEKLRTYREQIIRRERADTAALRDLLLRFMCRTERSEQAGAAIEEQLLP